MHPQSPKTPPGPQSGGLEAACPRSTVRSNDFDCCETGDMVKSRPSLTETAVLTFRLVLAASIGVPCFGLTWMGTDRFAFWHVPGAAVKVNAQKARESGMADMRIRFTNIVVPPTDIKSQGFEKVKHKSPGVTPFFSTIRHPSVDLRPNPSAALYKTKVFKAKSP